MAGGHRRWSAFACVTCVVGCSHGWDDYAPEPAAVTPGTGGEAGSSAASTSTSGAATSASSGTHGGSAGQGGDGGAPGGSGGTAGAGGSVPGTVEYVATVADCIAITDPDPDECLMAHGPAKMTIDSSDPALLVRHSYVRFDLDGALDGKIVDTVTLRLVVGPDTASASTQAGDIWAVSAFTRPELFLGVPTAIGNAPIATSVGMVMAAQVVDFVLPPATVGASTAALFLGILPLNDNGVDYQNLQGANPPRLHIAYH
jgi:hypothetical protein